MHSSTTFLSLSKTLKNPVLFIAFGVQELVSDGTVLKMNNLLQKATFFRQLVLSCHMEDTVFVLQEMRLETCSRSVHLFCRGVCKFCKRFLFQRIFQAQFG